MKPSFSHIRYRLCIADAQSMAHSTMIDSSGIFLPILASSASLQILVNDSCTLMTFSAAPLLFLFAFVRFGNRWKYWGHSVENSVQDKHEQGLGLIQY